MREAITSIRLRATGLVGTHAPSCRRAPACSASCPGSAGAAPSAAGSAARAWRRSPCRPAPAGRRTAPRRLCPLVTWAPTTEPALVPTTRSAVVRSTPASASPFRIPSSQAMPVTPPPPRTSAVRVMGPHGLRGPEPPLDGGAVRRPGAQDRVAEVGTVGGVGRQPRLERDAVALSVEPARTCPGRCRRGRCPCRPAGRAGRLHLQPGVRGRALEGRHPSQPGARRRGRCGRCPGPTRTCGWSARAASPSTRGRAQVERGARHGSAGGPASGISVGSTGTHGLGRHLQHLVQAQTGALAGEVEVGVVGEVDRRSGASVLAESSIRTAVARDGVGRPRGDLARESLVTVGADQPQRRV